MSQGTIPATEEGRYKQAFLQTLLRWGGILVPLNVVFGLVTLLWSPSWEDLLTNVGLVIMLGVLLWSMRRVRQGDVVWSTRALVAIGMLIMVSAVLYKSDESKARNNVPLGLLVLLATFLDTPKMALRWAAVAALGYLGALLLPRWLHLPAPELSPFKDLTSRVLIVGDIILIAVLGRVLMRNLRDALGKSESARHQLERANANLIEMERTLSAATADLERSNQELGSFAYVVSHDLRAPLRALNNYSRFLQEDAADRLDPGSHEQVQAIIDSARHMDALVEGLLEYSRIGRIKLKPEAVNVRELVERITAAMRLAEKADVTLPAGAPIVWASPQRLEQIFSSLLDNAVKFRRPEVRPAVAIEWADRGDGWELAVRDNGIGIAEKDFERVFGLFQRLGTQASREDTGIGLAIVQKAVQERGGRVWIESTPGQGSVFRFTLPGKAEAP